MANNGGKGFLLVAKFYKSANNVALLDPKKRNMERKASVHPEGTAINKQENTTTKHLSMLKIQAYEIYVKLIHPGEDRMRATVKHLHYRVKGVLEVCEDCDMAKSKQKFLHTVAEERNLNSG